MQSQKLKNLAHEQVQKHLITRILIGKLLVYCSFLTFILSLSHQSVAQSNILLKPQNCLVENNLRSLNSNSSTYIRFINRTNSLIKVYWIDFTGKRQHYFDLAPNQTQDQQTYVTHPWLIAESGSNQPCINIFFPNKQPGTVIIK